MSTLVDLLLSKRGVVGGIGRRAVSAALAQGYSEAEIAAAGEPAKAQVKIEGFDTKGFDEAFAKIGESDSGYFGDAGDTSHIHAMEPGEEKDAAIQAYHAKQDEFVGGADTASMRIGGQSWTDIENYMDSSGKTNPAHSASSAQGASDYSQMLDRIGMGADLEEANRQNTANTNRINTLSGNLSTLQGEYGTLSGKYSTLQNKYDAMGKQYTNLQADVAQAAKDAMKIKYTGSTAEQNPSAMGIQAAQGTPFRGSGLAGTAALARPNKGLKIKTLNV